MSEKKNIVINQLPAKTWYWLRVNDTKLEWDEENTVCVPTEEITATAEQTTPTRIDIQGEGAFTTKRVNITADADTSVTVFENFSKAENLSAFTDIRIQNNAVVKLIQVQLTDTDSVLYNHINTVCEGSGRLELIQIFVGKGDIYSDTKVDLNGDGSSLQCDTGYIGVDKRKIDINIAVNHFGKNTECDINADGALKDSAHKVFRGTIDFKKGSSGSVGNEQETVILLGDEIVNKTIPLILCAEENVVGNHGATIGELDDDTLFYFESRGINKLDAENIMVKAAIDHLVSLTNDEDTENKVDEYIKEVL